MKMTRKYSLKIIYVTSFDIALYSGKNRATRQKGEAIKSLSPTSVIVSAKGFPRFLRYLSPLFVEFVATFHVITKRPDIVISRGAFGFILNSVARFLGATIVREVHAANDESRLITSNRLKQLAIVFSSQYSNAITRMADVRIFNHPDLLNWYRSNVKNSSFDFYCYNGGSRESVSGLSRSQAIAFFDLDPSYKYLVFTGSVAKWHGVDYLIDLQAQFDKNSDKFKVVVGGGSIQSYSGHESCINITPLDDLACAKLIRAASLCLLPVKNNRVSPGSPLKLYDYILNRRYVVTQENINGYSDEVQSMQVGLCVDFTNSEAARLSILRYFSSIETRNDSDYPQVEVEWVDRITYWVDMIQKFQLNSRGRG